MDKYYFFNKIIIRMRYLIIVCLFVVFIPSKINAQQCNDNLVNMSYSLNDVAYVSNETFITIGDGGKILRTEDAGISWKEINSGTSVYLMKIQFITDSIGYILGDYDNLFKTEDAGTHWFPLKMINSGYPYCRGLNFFSPDSGFVFGGNGKIFKTNDGGRSWEKLNSNAYDNLNSISFSNKSNGFACGSSNLLLKTTDGGETWKSIDMSSFGFNVSFIKIVFIDENIGYLLGNNGIVIKTTDGGASWIYVSTVSTDYAVSMNFINKNIGYIIGGWTGSTFYRTMNGGLTWQPVSYGFAGSLSGIAQNKTGSKGVVVGNGAGYGYTSESGRFILYFNELDNSWKNACFLNGSLDFYTIAFVESKTAYLFGGYYQSTGVAYKTIDAGTTWNQLAFHPARNIYQSFFVNKDTAYVCSDSLYKTTDGGEIWSGISNQTGKLYFNHNLGWILGSTSIYRTNNSGRDWEKVLTTNNFFTDFSFINATTGYAVGYNCIYKSIDSGKVWTPYDGLPRKYYKSIYFQNKDTGFIGGENGLLYKTENGGVKWDTITTGINIGINDIKFKNDTDGFILTNNAGGISNIYITHNGGNTWQLLRQVTENAYDFFITNDGDVYFAGERGTLMNITKSNPPSMPGYILGKQTIIKNTPTKYSILSQPGISYNWEVSNNQVFENFNDSILISFSEKGKYTISVTPINACSIGTSRKYEITVLDSLPTKVESTITKSITVYPNPFCDNLKISIPDGVNNNTKLTIYDLQGKVIITEEYENGINEINLSLPEIKEGLYVLKIIKSNYISTTKLIKR